MSKVKSQWESLGGRGGLEVNTHSGAIEYYLYSVISQMNGIIANVNEAGLKELYFDELTLLQKQLLSLKQEWNEMDARKVAQFRKDALEVLERLSDCMSAIHADTFVYSSALGDVILDTVHMYKMVQAHKMSESIKGITDTVYPSIEELSPKDYDSDTGLREIKPKMAISVKGGANPILGSVVVSVREILPQLRELCKIYEESGTPAVRNLKKATDRIYEAFEKHKKDFSTEDTFKIFNDLCIINAIVKSRGTTVAWSPKGGYPEFVSDVRSTFNSVHNDIIDYYSTECSKIGGAGRNKRSAMKVLRVGLLNAYCFWTANALSSIKTTDWLTAFRAFKRHRELFERYMWIVDRDVIGNFLSGAEIDDLQRGFGEIAAIWEDVLDMYDERQQRNIKAHCLFLKRFTDLIQLGA